MPADPRGRQYGNMPYDPKGNPQTRRLPLLCFGCIVGAPGSYRCVVASAPTTTRKARSASYCLRMFPFGPVGTLADCFWRVNHLLILSPEAAYGLRSMLFCVKVKSTFCPQL